MIRFARQIIQPARLAPLLPPLLLIVIGITAGIIAWRYDVGSFTGMGPGFVPLMLGIGLVLLCALILWREPAATPDPAGGQASGIAWRPFCAVTAGILAWVLLAESAGFLIATVAQVVLSALALPAPRWRGTIILAGILAIAGYLLFVVQLGVPLEAVG